MSVHLSHAVMVVSARMESTVIPATALKDGLGPSVKVSILFEIQVNVHKMVNIGNQSRKICQISHAIT